MRNSNMRKGKLGYPNNGSRQKGAVLVIGLMVTTVLSIVAVNAAKSTVVQERMANNYRFSIEAMNNAENGSLRALGQINAQELILNGHEVSILTSRWPRNLPARWPSKFPEIPARHPYPLT